MTTLSIAQQKRGSELAVLIGRRDLDAKHVNDGLIQSLGLGGAVAKSALDQAKMRQDAVDALTRQIEALEALSEAALIARYFPPLPEEIRAALAAGVTFTDTLSRGQLV